MEHDAGMGARLADPFAGDTLVCDRRCRETLSPGIRARAAAANRGWCRLLILVAVTACGPSRSDLDPDHAAALEDSVAQFAGRIPPALAEDGPMAWLQFFDAEPSFFMASDGQLVFPSHDSATAFVARLAETVAAIDLEWIDFRATPLSPGLAEIATAYRETITDTAGVTSSFGGYMTGVARHTPDGWRLRSLHWSSPVPPRH